MTLVAYFSYSGNTKKAAEQIAELVKADLFEIKTENAYSEDYQTCVNEAREELAQNARPALVGAVEDITKYNTIILGFPNWCSTCPMPVLSFLENYDLAGKTIHSFVLNGGGGVGHSAADIAKSAADAEVTESINGNNLSEEQIKEWLGIA